MSLSNFLGAKYIMFVLQKLKNTTSKPFGLFPAILVCFSLSACDLAHNYTRADRAGNMEIQDYRDGWAERTPELETPSSDTSNRVGIPEMQPYVSTATSSIQPMPLVSVAVDQSVPIRDVLFELAKQADYDLELDPNIRGSIIFTARNKPFDVVIKRISDIAGLRYKFEEDFLRVELDTPYNKLYKIDYLSFIRNNQGAVSTNVSVVSGDGADTGSSFSASSESNSDFWGELEAGLSQILGGARGSALRTNRDPRITAAPSNPVNSENGSTNNQDDREVVLNVESLPVDAGNDDFGSSTGDGEASTQFSINKQAGMVNIYATEKQQKEVQAYLEVLKKAVTSQVLIEAKIFEVNLFDEYITGIDWQALSLGPEGFGNFLSSGGATSLNTAASGLTRGLVTAPIGSSLSGTNPNNFTLGYLGNDLEALVQAISGFGTVRALASPRLTTLNNQSAVLNVATNQVFFEIEVESTDKDDDGDIDTVEIDSTINSVPEGVLVNVQPSINLDTRKISLALRPTVTRVVGTERDPGVAFAASTIPGAANLESLIPEVNVQEIDTVVNVSSGQAIVMGGLLQDRTTNLQEGVPVLGEMPIVGSLFKKQNDLISKTELVIFIKATIIEDGADTIHATDKDLYRKFSGDRRPFKL